MNSQQPAPRGSVRQWVIAVAVLVAAVIMAVVVSRPEAPPPAAPAATTAPPNQLPPPKLKPAIAGEEAPAPTASAERAVSCRACQEKNRGGLCQRDMGCEGLSGEDRTLCENLLSCLRAHPDCYTQNPVRCYCGPGVTGLECVKHPQGECFQEALAASKTTDLTQSAQRFYRPDFPSGRATQVAACNMRACKDECGEARL